LVIWNLATSEKLLDFDLKPGFSAGADYSPDGSLLAISVFDGVLIVNAETLKPLRALRPPVNPRKDWGSVRFTADGKWVVANCGPFLAALDPLEIQPTIMFRGGIQSFLRFDISRDGEHLAAGSWDLTVRQWNFRTGEIERTLVGHEAFINTVGFALDDSLLVSTSDDGVVKTWNTKSAHEPGVMNLKGGMLASVVAPGESAIFYGMNRVRAFDIKQERELPMTSPPYAMAVSVSPSGQFMAYSEGGPDLFLWDLRTGGRAWSSRGPIDKIGESGFSADGALIGTTALEGTVSVWDAASGSLKQSFESASEADHLSPVRFNPRAPEMAIGGSRGELRLWNTSTWERRSIKYPSEFGHRRVLAINYSADGKLLVSCEQGGGITVWDTATWSIVRHLNGISPNAWCAAFSPDGQRLAVGGHDRMVHILETHDLRETLLLRGHSGVVRSVAWTPDGRRVISAGVDGAARVWDAAPPVWDVSVPTTPP
jgi:WD40 repeat protein